MKGRSRPIRWFFIPVLSVPLLFPGVGRAVYACPALFPQRRASMPKSAASDDGHKQLSFYLVVSHRLRISMNRREEIAVRGLAQTFVDSTLAEYIADAGREILSE